MPHLNGCLLGLYDRIQLFVEGLSRAAETRQALSCCDGEVRSNERREDGMEGLCDGESKVEGQREGGKQTSVCLATTKQP